jgi:two-component system, chemotaxis family, protein-glutamate methylesterase/glutaminase
MAKIRVLVVEDSLTVRKRLVEVLESDPSLQVVAEAADGQRAVELCQTLRPDVMTLDMMLPLLTGVEVTERVMAYCPTPILIVSASVNRGELFKTYEALAAGALDVLEKPMGSTVIEGWEQKLIAEVKLISRIKVISHPRARLSALLREQGTAEVAAPAEKAPATSRSGYRVVAIGASTGGPGAVLDVLRKLPGTFPLPVLIVIHLGEPFAMALAEWLDGHSALNVRYARDGEALPASGVIMAPPGRHLLLSNGCLRLSDGPERHSCRPSVDVLFESLAREVGPGLIACLLTGMGRDGALGMLAARQAGAMTLAQDEASSVVFGMPAEAIRLGAAQRVLAIEEFASTLLSLSGELAMRRAL